MKDSILPLDRFTTSRMESKPRWTWPIMESHARPGTIPGAMILTLKVIKERVWEDLWRSVKTSQEPMYAGVLVAFHCWTRVFFTDWATHWNRDFLMLFSHGSLEWHCKMTAVSLAKPMSENINFYNVLFQWWSTWNELIRRQRYRWLDISGCRCLEIHVGVVKPSAWFSLERAPCKNLQVSKVDSIFLYELFLWVKICFWSSKWMTSKNGIDDDWNIQNSPKS